MLPAVPLASVKGLLELRVTLEIYPSAVASVFEPAVMPRPDKPTAVAPAVVSMPKEMVLPSVAVSVKPELLELATTPVLPV